MLGLSVAVNWGETIRELVGSTIFSIVGILILVGSFLIIDKLTPGSLWKELIEEHNTAIAILLGAAAIGISMIISAAMLGDLK